MQTQLEQLGFSKNEAAVYVALLEIGQTTTGAIIKKLNIHRNIVYEMLDKLVKRGVVAQTTISGKMHFQAVNPEKILDLEKERLNIARDVVPELKKVQRKEKQEITVHQGSKEMEEVRRNIIKELPRGSTYCILNAIGGAFYEATKKFYPKIEKERVNKEIKQKLLISSSDYQEVMKNIQSTGLDDIKTEWKVMPANFKSPAAVIMYLDKIIFQIIEKEDPTNPTMITIKNRNLAESYQAYFEMLWRQDVTMFSGFKEVTELFQSMLRELNQGELYLVLGANWGDRKLDTFKFFQEFHQSRQEKGVRVKLLFNAGTEKLVKKFKDNFKRLAEIKYLPLNLSSKIQLNIFKDKVIFIVWREVGPVAFLIKDKKVNKTFREYFSFLWNQKTRQYFGREGMSKMIDEFIATGQDLYLLGSTGMMLERYPDLYEKIERAREKYGLKRIDLAIERVRKMKYSQAPNINIKYLPDEFGSPTVTWIFGDKFVNAVWSDPEVITIVEDQDIVDGFMKRFNYLWSIAKD